MECWLIPTQHHQSVCAQAWGWGDRSGRKCLTCRIPHYEMRTRRNIFQWQLTGEIQERLKQNSKGRGGRTGEVGRKIRSESAQALLHREHFITIPRGVWGGAAGPCCVFPQDLCLRDICDMEGCMFLTLAQPKLLCFLKKRGVDFHWFPFSLQRITVQPGKWSFQVVSPPPPRTHIFPHPWLWQRAADKTWVPGP